MPFVHRQNTCRQVRLRTWCVGTALVVLAPLSTVAAYAQDQLTLRGTSDTDPVQLPTISSEDGSVSNTSSGSSFPSLATSSQQLDQERNEFGMQGPAATNPFGEDDAGPADTADSDVVASEIIDDELTTGGAQRAEAAQPLQTGVGEPLESPYDAPGIQVGAITLRPTLEIGATFSRGTSRSEDAGPPVAIVSEERESRGLEAVLGLDFDADYGRTQITGSASATAPFELSGDDADPLSAEFQAEIIRQLTADQSLTATFGYSFDSEDPVSAAVDNAVSLTPGQVVTTQPSNTNITATVGYQRSIGPVVAGVTLGASRTFLGDVTFADGSSVSQSDLNSTDITARLRGELDTGAVFTPFAELDLGVRRFDDPTDANGIDRNTTQFALRGGVAWDSGEKFSGEVAVGYLFEDIADPSLSDIAGLSLAGSVAWSPRRDIELGLALSTETQPTGLQNAAGSIVYNADFTAEYQARANLTLNSSLGIEYEDGFGEQSDATTVSGQVGATYWFNRFAGVTGRLGYDQTFSSDAVRESDEWSAFIGLRLQR